MQRDEIVLKKFGLLDRDFDLKPFLLALLKEQIEAYYDSKTKTVNMLDWVDVDDQKPVLAHELTHALQDQHSDLEKWDDQTPDDVSADAAGDTDHLARDEMDTARDAVAEGQATAVMMDYVLKPMGKSLVKDPEVMDIVQGPDDAAPISPVMARAPLLLTESMLFPYREGLSFEQDVWMDQGQTAAFAGALDRPPTSSWEIINPREYEKHKMPAVPLLPDIHPLVDKLYVPYDIGQVGQLDVHILAELFGGDEAARDLTPAWNGGIYWAGQLRSAPRQRTRRAQNRWPCSTCRCGGIRLGAGLCQALCRQPGAEVLRPEGRRERGCANGRPIGGAGVFHQRRAGGDYDARQDGVCCGEFPAGAGAQADLADS